MNAHGDEPMTLPFDGSGADGGPFFPFKFGFVHPLPMFLDEEPWIACTLILPCGHGMHIWLAKLRDAPVFLWMMPEEDFNAV